MKNKIFAGVIILAVIVIIIIGSYAKKEDKILAILPLSGANSQHGEWAKRGIDMAIKNHKTNLKVVYEDSQLDAKKAISIINQYKTDKSVLSVVSLGSPVAMAISPIVNEYAIPTFSIVSAPAYSSPNDYTFRINGTAAVEMSAIKNEITNGDAKRIAIVYLNNDYGRGLDASFKNVISSNLIVAEEGFLQTDTNLRSQIIKIKNSNPDKIFIASWGKEAGIFIKQAREMGVTSEIVCGSACYSPELITSAGKAADGVVIVAPSINTNQEFKDKYFSLYHEKPNYVTTRAYDATGLVIESLNKCENNRECIKNYIANISNYNGLIFPIKFDQNGDLLDQYQTFVIKDGDFVSK